MRQASWSVQQSANKNSSACGAHACAKAASSSASVPRESRFALLASSATGFCCPVRAAPENDLHAISGGKKRSFVAEWCATSRGGFDLAQRETGVTFDMQLGREAQCIPFVRMMRHMLIIGRWVTHDAKYIVMFIAFLVLSRCSSPLGSKDTNAKYSMIPAYDLCSRSLSWILVRRTPTQNAQ